MIFKNPYAYLQFVCRTDSQPASQPAVSPGSDGCRASRITLNNSLLRPIYENRILKTIIPMRYGDLSRRKWSPATTGPAGPSMADLVAIDGPAGPYMAAMDGPPCRKWSPHLFCCKCLIQAR